MKDNHILIQRGKLIVQYVITWIVLFALFAIIRTLGASEVGAVQTDFTDRVYLVLGLGSITGLISAICQMVIEELLYQHLSFIRLIIVKGVLILLISLIILLGAFFYFRNVHNPDLELIPFFVDPNALAILIFIVGSDILVSFVRKISQMLGERTFHNLVRGKYYKPRKEERIFMFLDLKGSTTIAEKLGFETYSQFIQDCFNDLGVIINYKAEIYQYVGDEAVLTWKTEEGLENQNFLQAFFKFQEQLSKRASYYREAYDTLPIFKAGAHIGPVMVAEVGKFKKEIAYHGDTINTAARIQANCNKFESDFIISKQLKEMVNKTDISVKELDSLQLRGKNETTTLYALDNKNIVFVN